MSSKDNLILTRVTVILGGLVTIINDILDEN